VPKAPGLHTLIKLRKRLSILAWKGALFYNGKERAKK